MKYATFRYDTVEVENGLYNTDEDPSLRIESFALINLRGVSTKLNKYSPCKRTRNLNDNQL